MKERLRRIALFTRPALLTIFIHGALLATLFAGWWLPFLNSKNERSAVIPIQAQVISETEIQQQVEVQKKKVEERQQVAKNLETLKIKQQQEKKKLEELEAKNEEEVKKQQDLKAQKKREDEKQAQEKKLKALEEKKLKENKLKALEEKKLKEKKLKALEEKKLKEKKLKELEKKKKKAEQVKKQKEVEKQKKRAEEKKRKEAERKSAEDALQKRIATEFATKTKVSAADAISALAGRINAKFKRNWVRPSNSIVGLIATVRVNLSPSGDVLSASVVKSSGNSFFDRSAEIAVKKASPLPFPPQSDFYEYIKVLDLEFNPDNY